MRQNTINRTLINLLIVLVFLAISIALVIPINAQSDAFATNTPEAIDNTSTTSDTSSALMFATNTPEGMTANDENTTSPLMFATNTPEGMTTDNTDTEVSIPSVSDGPQALLFNYASRFWLEADFVQLVLEQVEKLEAEDDDTQLAVNVLLYEMDQRFPSAPSDPEQRIELINAMMNAPIGALDMRDIVRPYVQTLLNDNPATDLIEENGFEITLTPINLNGDDNPDRVVNILYRDEDGVRYHEYLLATATNDESYTLSEPVYELPAVPFGGVESVSIEYAQDVNEDTLDELVLRVKDGAVSDRLFILQHRNGRTVDLVDPALQLRVGEIILWNVNGENVSAPDLTLLEFQAESLYPDWTCLNQIEYTWVYERNLYRRTQDLNARLMNVDSLGCTLANAELFNLENTEAISTIEGALLEYGFDAPSTNRALMTLSVFYMLSGRIDDARNTAQSVIPVDAENSWEARQANALLDTTNSTTNTALDICEAIAIANEFPACDVNGVIGSYLEFVDLTTDEDLEIQLQAVGLPIIEKYEVSEVGRATRTVVIFNYFDSGWWGFVDNGDGTYRFEPAEAPVQFAEASFPEPLISAPPSAIEALLVDNEPSRVLSIIDNTLRENPNTPLSPAGLYLQALAYDFTADRGQAREGYYNIWETYPDSIWGAISAEHLELR